MSIADSTTRATRGPAGNSDSLVQTALDNAKDGVARAEQVLQEKSGQATAAIGDHPWKALAIAGSIGIVVGLLLNRR